MTAEDPLRQYLRTVRPIDKAIAAWAILHLLFAETSRDMMSLLPDLPKSEFALAGNVFIAVLAVSLLLVALPGRLAKRLAYTIVPFALVGEIAAQAHFALGVYAFGGGMSGMLAFCLVLLLLLTGLLVWSVQAVFGPIDASSDAAPR